MLILQSKERNDMSEKTDKFVVFSKKFADLDEEGQDRLVTAAHRLLKIHRNVKKISTTPLSDVTIQARVRITVSMREAKNCANSCPTLVGRLGGQCLSVIYF
jgi:hypothetical protein